MNARDTVDTWLKQAAPVVEQRYERVGFGVLSRNIDGASPKDYVPILDNLPVKLFFSELFPSARYSPELDKQLQPMRNELLTRSAQESSSNFWPC